MFCSQTQFPWGPNARFVLPADAHSHTRADRIQLEISFLIFSYYACVCLDEMLLQTKIRNTIAKECLQRRHAVAKESFFANDCDNILYPVCCLTVSWRLLIINQS